MARKINKEKTEEQKKKIADTAVKLFILKGCENTSMNEIIKEAGIAKGTFYHYFKNKEDILNYLSFIVNKEMLPIAQRVVDDREMDALKKLNRVMISIKRYKVRNRKLIMLLAREMFKGENWKLKQKMFEHNFNDFVPVFESILKQGKKEGVFDIGSPRETAELLLRFSFSMGDVFAPVVLSKKLTLKNIVYFTKKALAFREAIKRLLGIKKGRLNIFDKKTLKKIMEK